MATSSNMENEDDDQPGGSGSAPLIPGYADINEYSQKTLRAVVMATRSSNDLPVGDDFDFYSTFRSVRDVLDIEGRRILTLLQRLLRHQNVKGNLQHGDSVELEDQFDVLMDANDQILERAGTLLDEASGIRKEETKLVIATATTAPTKAATSWNKKTPAETSKPAAAYKLMTARNIQRPQLRFRDKIDNGSHPFKPHLRHKPHALKSLEESLKLPDGVSLEEAERPEFVHPHPYAVELDSFRPAPHLLQKVTPQEPQPTNLTPLLMVDTPTQFKAMVDDLKTQTEIAVDLEHHSYRSFQGLTCLMQISTRVRDYIVDTLELRDEIPLLNEVFADPKITKVLHGADSDICWLQRDFGVYIVNMFDTGQAARVLGFSRFSLAHLLMNYCRLEADKQFQLADWRIRPLPSELVSYAREDTHYLLYIYDMMRNQLIDQGNEQSNLLLSVYERSKLVAGKVYQKPSFTDQDYMELYRKSKKVFNTQQLAAFRDLFAWRDGIARVEDESLGYVLPNHMLLQIAEILPRERQGVLACCNPIPPLVRQSLVELHNMVLQAREITVIKVEKAPMIGPMPAQLPQADINSLLTCPHDMTHTDQRIADIEQTIADTGLIATTSSMFSQSSPAIRVKRLPTISAFSSSSAKGLSKAQAQKVAEQVQKLFQSPFKKYMPCDDKNPVKAERRELWVLKPPTSLKRKADGSKKENAVSGEVDLDSFQPEFVPPTKRPKVAINLKQSTTTSTSSLFRASAPKDAGQTSSLFQSQESSQVSSTTRENTERRIEKQLKSIRQEITQKKKKEKKKLKKDKKKAGNLQPAGDQPATVTASPTDNIISNTSVPSSMPKADSTAPGSNNSINCTNTGKKPTENACDVGDAKDKKKKKKKKMTVQEVEQNFQAFDYAAAEKKLLQENKKKKKTDVYNPALPSRSGKHKDKVRKPKLAGPKSNASVSFGPGMGSPAAKKKKKKGL